MSWRDQLLPGSFRSAGFVFRGGSAEFGRRVALHEYPQQDKPWAEDLGRKARSFSIEAILIGPDYNLQRDALIAAIEQPGPGELVHPRFGTMRATVISFRVSETTREGGMCTCSIEFIESGELQFPRAIVDTPAEVELKAAAAQASAIENFCIQFDVTKQPVWVVDAAIAQLTEVIEGVREANSRVNTTREQLAEVTEKINTLGDELDNYVSSARALATQIATTIDAVMATGTDLRAALGGLDSLSYFGLAAKAVALTTPSRKIQAKNQHAVQKLVQRMATITAIRSSSQIEFSSYDEAIEIRDTLVASLDKLMLEAEYELFNTLDSLRTALVEDISARGADLASVIRHLPRTTLPAIILAYQLHGEGGKDIDLIKRNNIRNPLFVQGGKSLEALSR